MPILPTNKLVNFLALFCYSGALLLLFLFPLTSNAAFTKQINYQGKLTNSAGSAVSDASYTIVFTLYDALTDGNVVWTETDTVTTQGGLFSLMLGSVSSLDNVNFNQPLYLTLNVNGDGEMTPRKTLGAVASAFTSARLDGNASSTAIDVSGYLSVSGNTTLATTTISGVLSVDQSFSLGSFDYDSNLETGEYFSDPDFVPAGGFNVNAGLSVQSTSTDYGMDDGVFNVGVYGLGKEIGIYGRGSWAGIVGIGSLDGFSRGGIFSGKDFGIQASSVDGEGLYVYSENGTALHAQGKTYLDGNATTTGYLTVGSAPLGANYGAGDLNISSDLVVGGGITLGGVYRTSWPGGAGGTDVNWSYNPLTDILTTATSTSGITVFGTSTLATTTMTGLLSINMASTSVAIAHCDDDLYDNQVDCEANGGTWYEGGTFDYTGNSTQGLSWVYSPFLNDYFFTSSYHQATSTDFTNDSDQAVIGVWGNSNSVGVLGEGSVFGVVGAGSQGGVFGLSSSDYSVGLQGLVSGSNSVGVQAIALQTDSLALLSQGNSYFNGNSTTTGYSDLASTTISDLTISSGLTLGGTYRTTWPSESTNDWQIVGGKLTPTSTIDILASQDFVLPGDGILKLGDVNLAYGSTTLGNYFFGEAGNEIMTGLNNIASGYNSLYSNDNGNSNTAYGHHSLENNTTGDANTAIGAYSLYSNTEGGGNVSYGNHSLQNNITGSNNVAIGASSITYNTTGSHNTANGIGSLRFNTTGSGNTSLGYFSGTSLSGITDSDYNSVSDTYSTFIGYGASRDGSRVASTTVLTNATAIGYNAKVGSSSAMVLGGTGADAVRVGIGTTTPEAFLDITGTYTSNSLTYGQSALYTFAPTASNDSLQYGSFLNAIATSSAGVNLANVTGSATYVNHYGAGTMTSAYGLATGVLNNGTGIIQDAYGLYLASTTGPVTNSYGIYQAGAGTTNYFEGDIKTRDGSIYKYGDNSTLAFRDSLGNWFLANSGNLTMSGTMNTAFGTYALRVNTSGRNNSAFGFWTLRTNTEGSYNSAFGNEALRSNTTGSYNVALGEESLYHNTTGEKNISLGYESLYSNTSGTGNLAAGYTSLLRNTTGSYNIALGVNSLAENITGEGNIGIGAASFNANISGSYNIGIGLESLSQNVSSTGTVAVGYRSGNRDDYSTNHTGSYNTYLGYMAGLGVPSTTPIFNAIAIGKNAIVSASNTMALGGLADDAVNVGIATSTAQFRLVVGSGITAEGVSSLQIPYGGLCVDSDGWCTPSTAGRISAVAYTTGSSDLAENYQAFEDNLEAGDIVTMTNINTSQYSNTIDTYGITKARLANAIIGVVSTKPGIILGLDNDEATNQNQKPVALSGRVPVKVNLEGGPILPGDAITLSSVAGIGTKATTSGQTIGYALETFDASKLNNASYGQVMVFVNLGYTHLSSNIADGSINLDELWQLDEITGEIKATASLNLNNLDLTNVRSITSASGNWGIDEAGNLRVKTVTAGQLCLGETCVNEDQLKSLLSTAGLLSVSTTPIITEEGPGQVAGTSTESLPGEGETGYGTS